MCAKERAPYKNIHVPGEVDRLTCRAECLKLGSTTFSYRNARGVSDEHEHRSEYTHGDDDVPACKCGDPTNKMGFKDDIDFDTYSLQGPRLMPKYFISAGDFDGDDCKATCLSKGASIWYAVWNSHGASEMGYVNTTRCRCDDPSAGDNATQLIVDPGYDAHSLAGPHQRLRTQYVIDKGDKTVDDCVKECSQTVPGAIWAANLNAMGVADQLTNAGLFTELKRCLCHDPQQEFKLDEDPEYDLYSLRGEC